MKKQFLLPVFAILLAAGGAFASNRFAPVFYQAGDSSCNGPINPVAPCTPGESIACTTEDELPLDYYYRPAGTGTECQQLFKDQ